MTKESLQPESLPDAEHLPRVTITYPVEVYGEDKHIELPWVTGVLANLSGTRNPDVLSLKEREFREINQGNFDEVLKSCAPSIVITSSDTGDADQEREAHLRFSQLDDFLPENIDPQGLPLSAVLGDPGFQQLEATWRGLYGLVSLFEPSDLIKFKILDVSKAELASDLQDTEKSFNTCALFSLIYRGEYEMIGGEPFGCLIGDYFIEDTAEDVSLLEQLSLLCAANVSPFISAAGPSAIGFEAFTDLNSADGTLAAESGPASFPANREQWESLREMPEAQFICLAMPRFLARPAYRIEASIGADTYVDEPVAERDKASCWSNCAYLVAANIARAYRDYGWPANIRGYEGGGRVDGLVISSEIGAHPKDFVEIRISDRWQHSLSKEGFVSLVQIASGEGAFYPSTPTIKKPEQGDDPTEAAQSGESVQLPNVLAMSRIVMYLRVMKRDQFGAFMDRARMEDWLNRWLDGYVTHGGAGTHGELSGNPLSIAHVQLRDVAGNPAYYILELSAKLRWPNTMSELKIRSRISSHYSSAY